MKKLLWMMLAALPMQAMANEEDPIAYKCYYCTPDEMEDVALAQGVGRHYVYDASDLKIIGIDVTHVSEGLAAHPFAAESWLVNQFLGLMALYQPQSGQSHIDIDNVSLLAPGTEHGRTSRLLWGQHLSALHPLHPAARETVHRFLMSHPDLRFLDTTHSGGKLLRFSHNLEKPNPITATMSTERRPWGTGLSWQFRFDHATRRWNYVWALGGVHPIQQMRRDFVPPFATGQFRYGQWDRDLAESFAERAGWAFVPVYGHIPYGREVIFRCSGEGDNVQCHVE